MAYNNKSILKDVNGKPIPQYFNASKDVYEVIHSKNNKIGVVLYDSAGNAVQSQALVNQILAKLDELIGVVT